MDAVRVVSKGGSQKALYFTGKVGRNGERAEKQKKNVRNGLPFISNQCRVSGVLI